MSNVPPEWRSTAQCHNIPIYYTMVDGIWYVTAPNGYRYVIYTPVRETRLAIEFYGGCHAQWHSAAKNKAFRVASWSSNEFLETTYNLLLSMRWTLARTDAKHVRMVIVYLGTNIACFSCWCKQWTDSWSYSHCIDECVNSEHDCCL